MDIGKRTKAILELAKFTGVEVTADFLKNTAEHFPQAGIPRIHNLIEGIYKPAGDPYALSIFSQSAIRKEREIYPDEIELQADGSWTLFYSAKNVALENEPNKSLFACMQDKVPVLVIASEKSESGSGAHHLSRGFGTGRPEERPELVPEASLGFRRRPLHRDRRRNRED